MTIPEIPLLRVEDLEIDFGGPRERVRAVQGVSFSLEAGRCLAVVGESGSGKSVTARCLLGLVGSGASVRASRLELDGEDLLTVGERRWRQIRGRRIALMSQDALSSLDPLRPVGAEIAEALRAHRTVDRARVPGRVIELLRQSTVPDPEVRARQYPHQLSGGLRQRALIASAMAADPALLVADEPTTALDVIVQAQILELLAAKKAAGTALLLISHDLAVVAHLADQIAVMHRGRIVESGPAQTLLQAPSHPYTRQLLAAVPATHAKGTRLSAAPGSSEPISPNSAAKIGSGRIRQEGGGTVLTAAHLTKSFAEPDGRRRTAVNDVSFTLIKGETLGMLGESGSGKSTTAQLVLGLLHPDAGEVRLLGRPWSDRPEAARRPDRSRIQLIPQDPLGAFDPRYTVRRIIGEALGASSRRDVRRRADRIGELLDLVGLEPGIADRRGRQLSGGQRQRVAIARAIAPDPDLLICDEPVSALDVSIQAQILDLLADVRDRLGVSMLFISHDLGVIYHTSDRVLVMKDGSVVESGTVSDIFHHPQHPYTRALLAAVARVGDTPDPALTGHRAEPSSRPTL